VNEAFVTPPPSEQDRIKEEAALLAAVWRSSADERLWTGEFVRPVPGVANSAFGARSVYNGKPRTPHGGADFLSPGGTPVHAPNAGRIAVARALYFTGNTVVIDHGPRLVFDARAPLGHRRAGRHFVAAGEVVGQVGANRPRHRSAPALGRARETTPASIRSRCSRCWGRPDPRP
jgi:septal ring factor EnvC (AmiA/AmiB activator)